jgi:prepilin-type N-terminal cleavage/methylation domain-containing protein
MHHTLTKIRFGRSGMTLIELAISAAVLAILATLLMINLSSSRIQARNARRQGDIETYTTAINQYNLFKGNAFITAPGGACALSGSGADTVATGADCTGASGLSFGKMNIHSLNGQVVSVTGFNNQVRVYANTSIADALKAQGLITTSATDPSNTNSAGTDATQPDYVFIRCCVESAKQNLSKSGTAFAIWAKLETIPTAVQKANTDRYCGSRFLQYDPTATYDMGMPESERSRLDTYGVAKSNASLNKMTVADETVPCDASGQSLASAF